MERGKEKEMIGEGGLLGSTKMFYYVLNNIYYLNFHYVLRYVKYDHLNAKIIRIQLNFIGCKCNSDYIILIPEHRILSYRPQCTDIFCDP